MGHLACGRITVAQQGIGRSPRKLMRRATSPIAVAHHRRGSQAKPSGCLVSRARGLSPTEWNRVARGRPQSLSGRTGPAASPGPPAVDSAACPAAAGQASVLVEHPEIREFRKPATPRHPCQHLRAPDGSGVPRWPRLSGGPASGRRGSAPVPISAAEAMAGCDESPESPGRFRGRSPLPWATPPRPAAFGLGENATARDLPKSRGKRAIGAPAVTLSSGSERGDQVIDLATELRPLEANFGDHDIHHTRC